MLREIKDDRSGLEDGEALRSSRGRPVPVHQDRDSTVGVQGVDEPRFLLLVCSERDMLDPGNRGYAAVQGFGELVWTHSYATLSP